jgi:hypothetical protein
METSSGQQDVQALEDSAERLAAEQLDLLAQLEQQLRAVRHTMTHIEKLRSARWRVGPELTIGERERVLLALSDAVASLDQQLVIEHGGCVEMQSIIGQMRARVADMRSRVQSPQTGRGIQQGDSA